MKKLVLIGGGHAHMVTLAKLNEFIKRGYKVTVIGPSPHHYYSGMGPGMLSRFYTPNDIRFATKQVVEKFGGVFIIDKAVTINPDKKTVHLEAGKPVSYDILSCNAGSFVPTIHTGDDTDIFTVKPIERLQAAQKRILALAAERDITVAVVGGGPSPWKLRAISGGLLTGIAAIRQK